MYTISSETADEDLTEFWAGFIARINQTTEWDLNQRNPASIDQLILRINPPKDGKPENHEKAKKAWRSALHCVDRFGVFVQRFGQFAVQGASIVFGPSQQCFNAISFVITAAQKYKEVFSNITILMERISVFLENLSIFMDDTNAEVKLDKRLRKTTYRVLEHFVVILSTTHRLTTDWKARAKLAVKNFAFGEDENIKGSLETLETLVSDVTNTAISVIVKDLGDAAKNIRGVERKVDVLDEKADRLVDSAEKQTTMLGQLIVADDRKSAREQEVKDLETIRTALGLDPLEESRKQWDRQMELWEDHVLGTGQWLLDKPSFEKWTDPRSASVACYTLKAPPGFGKSYLTSIVIQSLRDKHRDDPRVFVAYYYLQGASVDRTSPMGKALKTIILQFANARRSEYAKLAAKACDGKTDFSGEGELLRRLIMDTTKNLEGTLFVVIDGLNDLEGGKEKPLLDVINQISADQGSNVESRFKVRLFLSGTNKVMDSLKVSSGIALPEVSIEEASHTGQVSLNEEDIQLYIEDQLNKMDRFDKGETTLKERVKADLSSGVRGDYSQLRLLLHDIKNSQYTSQIEDVLKRASESRAELIANKIGILNNTLDKKEIRDINELLSWVTAVFESLNATNLEAILALKGDPPRSLEKQIRERYSILFELDDDMLVTLRNGVVDYLKQLHETTSNDRSQGNGSAEEFEDIEVALVRKVLRTHFRKIFGDEQVYTKFGFDDFFEKKRGDQAVRVQLNESESHTKVAQGCLAAMCDKYENPRTQGILDYAYKWFVEHLEGVNLELTEAVTKQDIGRKLVRLLREPALIESWWTQDRMYLKQWFVYSSYSRDLLQVIHNFLKDPIVLQGMSDMPTERQWILSVTSGDTASFDLYGSIAKVMQRRWFESEDLEWQSAFSWLSGYKLVSRGESPDEDDDISAEHIREIETWTKDELSNADEVDRWNERLAATFFFCECWEMAARNYRQAIERKPNDWRLRKNFAKSLGENKDYAEAVSILDDLMKRSTNLLQSDEAYTTAYWTEMLLWLGEWNVERKDFGGAERAYCELLDHSFDQKKFLETDMNAAVGLLSALNSQERHADAIGLLSKLSTYSDPDGVSWLALLFQENCNDDAFHKHLTTAAKRSQILRNVAEQYEHAIEIIRAKIVGEKLWRLLWLQYFLAALLWAMGSVDDQEVALDLWQQIASRELNYDSDTAPMERECRFYSSRSLAPALLAKAKAVGLRNGLNSEVAAFTARMEWLIELDLASIRPVGDPRITLARSYHLAGEKARARTILSEYLRNAIRETQEQAEDTELNDSFYKMAVALQALDDDENAIAAWSQYVPTNISKDAAPDGDACDSSRVSNEMTTMNDANGEQRKQSEADAQPGADAEEEDEDHSPPRTNGVEAANEDTAAQNADIDAAQPIPKGSLSNSCDGQCGTDWTYADDIYVCKDCLDVQFDPACYTKLKAGELEVPVCGQDHDHLHIPPFDKDTWMKQPKDSVIIGGTLMTRKAWIEGIAKEWEIDEESMEKKKRLASAAHRIQRAWRFTKLSR